MRACSAWAVVVSLALPTVPLAGQTPPAIQEGRALRIGMIGAGAMGAPIGLALAEAGDQVLFSSRNPAELMELVQQASPRASAGYTDAAAYFAGVIGLAVSP